MEGWEAILDELRDEHNLLSELIDGDNLPLLDIIDFRRKLVETVAKTNGFSDKKSKLIRRVGMEYNFYWNDVIVKRTGCFISLYPSPNQ